MDTEIIKERKSDRLIELEILFKKYMDDPQYVFGSTHDKIIVLQKTKTTITNEIRKVTDSKYALYRADRLILVDIANRYQAYSKRLTHISIQIPFKLIHYEDDMTIEITNYNTGDEIYEDNYDHNHRYVYGFGILYHKTLEAAFYHNINLTLLNGVYKKWSNGGDLQGIYDCSYGIMTSEIFCANHKNLENFLDNDYFFT